MLLDLPEFDLPTKATSKPRSGGNGVPRCAPIRKLA
jgi:hypothetical protein